MERREHYDPEDIESLLQDRSFDELLEEERAYVLRHLSSREEYEAMRALLHQVREDDSRREPVTAGPEVRDAVMSAFRAQQRPSWQIWLNSVGALLWPKEASAMWRPALAFATLALLIIAGVQVMRTGGEAMKNQQVVENKPQAAEEQPAQKVGLSEALDSVAAPKVAPSGDVARKPSEVEDELIAQGAVSEAKANADISVVEEAEITTDEQPAVTLTTKDAAADNLRDDKSSQRAEREANEADGFAAQEKRKAEAPTPAEPAQTATGSHVVTEVELLQNMSVANTSTRSKHVLGKQQSESATVLSGSPEVIALLATGW
ncbi:MAG: hypothetical protein IPM46_16210 [Flavobacteriales bacterium]|nr:hypothetical protein [Flavobacteriales bacterium]